MTPGPDPRHLPDDETKGPDMSPAPATDEELEQLLRDALGARARAAVPDDRRPPVVEWPARTRRRPWTTSLAVAASIAVVAVAGGVAVAHQHRVERTPPATQGVTAEPTSGTPTTTGTPSPPGTPTAAGQRVAAAGATLTVPAGYTFRQDLGGPASAPPPSPTWCFDTQGTSDCVISFVAYDPTTVSLDADAEGGYPSDHEYCGPGVPVDGRTLVAYDEPTWGGRAAELRVWDEACPSGPSRDVVQYTVMTPQAYGLVTDHATTQVRDAMARIVASSVLPAATSTTRLYDNGYLRSARPTPGGTTVTIARVVTGRSGNGGQVHTYVIPTAVYPTDKLQSAVGTLISVRTDGSPVATSIVLPGG